jgi:hypothetical protein
VLLSRFAVLSRFVVLSRFAVLSRFVVLSRFAVLSRFVVLSRFAVRLLSYRGNRAVVVRRFGPPDSSHSTVLRVTSATRLLTAAASDSRYPRDPRPNRRRAVVSSIVLSSWCSLVVSRRLPDSLVVSRTLSSSPVVSRTLSFASESPAS